MKELQGLFEALNILWVINVSNQLSSVGALSNRCYQKKTQTKLNKITYYEQQWLSIWETCVFIFNGVWSFSLVFVMALYTLGNPLSLAKGQGLFGLTGATGVLGDGQ